MRHLRVGSRRWLSLALAFVTMNLLHRWLCRSEVWARVMQSRMLPWACHGVALDGDVLELGPGYGVTTRWLADYAGRLTAVEVDPELAAGLRSESGQRADIHTGSATDLPFPDASFDAVVCFTMLHHIPSPRQQDQLFTEAARVLRPGGTFAGSDSTDSIPFRALHLGDTMVLVPPETLPERLQGAGLIDAGTNIAGHSLRFRGTRPQPPA